MGLRPNLLKFVFVWTWPETHNLLGLGLDLRVPWLGLAWFEPRMRAPNSENCGFEGRWARQKIQYKIIISGPGPRRTSIFQGEGKMHVLKEECFSRVFQHLDVNPL